MLKPRILILTRYGPLGASSRLRFFRYEQKLVAAGFDPVFQALLPDSYLLKLYRHHRRPWGEVFFAYIKRAFFLLFSARRFDLVLIEKELFPGVPTFIEKVFLKTFRRFVLDYDDAIHLHYESKGFGRLCKIQKLVAQADLIFAGSPSLAEMALEHNPSVVRLPTAVESYRYYSATRHQPLRLGWIGSPASESYILELLPLIARLGRSGLYEFHLMGAQSPRWLDQEGVTIHAWSELAEQELLKNLDVGLMPLADTPWARGKCSYKLLLYMSHGIPCLASRVGMNTEVVTDGFNGYLVAQDWQQQIERFLEMSDVDYDQMRKNAWERCHQNYTTDVVFDLLQVQLFKLIGRQ